MACRVGVEHLQRPGKRSQLGMGKRLSAGDWAVHKKLAANIRRERRRKGWTIEQLAEQSGITDRKLRRLETGEIVEPGRHIICLLVTLGCGPDRLFSGIDNIISRHRSDAARARRAVPRPKTVKKRRVKKS